MKGDADTARPERKRPFRIFYEGSLFTSVGGGRNHLVGLASALRMRGCSVDVVAPAQLDLADLNGSVQVHRLSARGPMPTRLVDYELGKASFLWKRRKQSADTVYLTRLATLGGATALARILGYTVVVEVNGPLSTEIRERVPFVGEILGKISEWMERRQLRAAREVVCVSGGLIAYVTRLAPDASVRVLPNGASGSISPELQVSIERRHAGGEAGLQCCYLGAVTDWYDVELLQRATSLLGEGAHLHVIGDGPRLPALRETASERRTLWGWLEREEVDALLRRCDVGVIPATSRSASAALRSPLKLYHYLSAGLAVVVSDVVEVEEALAPYVVSYRAGDARDLKRALDSAGRECRRDAPKELWSWDSRAEQLSRWLAQDLAIGERP